METTEGQPFGALLRAYRVAAGLSQEELAERARLSRRTISDLERGITTAPYRDTIALLADALALGTNDRAALEGAVHRARASSAADQEPAGPPGDPLLATKLAIPPAREGLIARPRLLERLQAGARGPLTLLSAPAGSGKTRLLGAWCASLDRRDTRVAWLSLDEADNDPTRFWRYVLTALDRASGVGGAALAFLRPADAPPSEAMLSALINAVAARAEDSVLILDDYHLIEAQAIHRLLAFLIEHLPPCLHLLLATRADPPLPLARLRAGGHDRAARRRPPLHRGGGRDLPAHGHGAGALATGDRGAGGAHRRVDHRAAVGRTVAARARPGGRGRLHPRVHRQPSLHRGLSAR